MQTSVTAPVGTYLAKPNRVCKIYNRQTNIATNRERNAYHEQRRDERIAELAELEAQLIRIEAETFVEVSRMRPTTGRVPWPRKLPAMHQFREALEERMRLEDERWRRERATDDEIFEQLMANEEKGLAERSDREDERMRRELRSMSSTEYAAYRAWADYFVAGLKSGELSMDDVLELLRR